MSFKLIKSTVSLDETRAKVVEVVPSSNDSSFVSVYIAIGKDRFRATANKAECIGLSLCKPGKTLRFFTTKAGFIKRITA